MRERLSCSRTLPNVLCSQILAAASKPLLLLWPGCLSVVAWACLTYSAVGPGAVGDVLQSQAQDKVILTTLDHLVALLSVGTRGAALCRSEHDPRPRPRACPAPRASLAGPGIGAIGPSEWRVLDCRNPADGPASGRNPEDGPASGWVRWYGGHVTTSTRARRSTRPRPACCSPPNRSLRRCLRWCPPPPPTLLPTTYPTVLPHWPMLAMVEAPRHTGGNFEGSSTGRAGRGKGSGAEGGRAGGAAAGAHHARLVGDALALPGRDASS